jgi:hypothetical protein
VNVIAGASIDDPEECCNDSLVRGDWVKLRVMLLDAFAVV